MLLRNWFLLLPFMFYIIQTQDYAQLLTKSFSIILNKYNFFKLFITFSDSILITDIFKAQLRLS